MICNEPYLSANKLLSDRNCVQIMAPGKSVAVVLPARYVPGERIGNVDRDVAAYLKCYMDDDFDVLLASNCYKVGFYFTCILSEDTHHRGDGYFIKIIVRSNNSASWCDDMFDSILAKGLNPVKLY
jgi:hypothetical protein